MPSTIEKLPNEPIVVLKLPEGYDLATEAVADLKKNLAFLDSLDEPVYFINDTSAVDSDLAAMIAGSNLAARGENPIFHHPNVLSVIVVTKSNLKKVAAKGMDSEVSRGEKHDTPVNEPSGLYPSFP